MDGFRRYLVRGPRQAFEPSQGQRPVVFQLGHHLHVTAGQNGRAKGPWVVMKQLVIGGRKLMQHPAIAQVVFGKGFIHSLYANNGFGG